MICSGDGLKLKWRDASCKSRHSEASRISVDALGLCHCQGENIPQRVFSSQQDERDREQLYCPAPAGVRPAETGPTSDRGAKKVIIRAVGVAALAWLQLTNLGGVSPGAVAPTGSPGPRVALRKARTGIRGPAVFPSMAGFRVRQGRCCRMWAGGRLRIYEAWKNM